MYCFVKVTIKVVAFALCAFAPNVSASAQEYEFNSLIKNEKLFVIDVFHNNTVGKILEKDGKYAIIFDEKLLKQYKKSINFLKFLVLRNNDCFFPIEEKLLKNIGDVKIVAIDVATKIEGSQPYFMRLLSGDKTVNSSSERLDSFERSYSFVYSDRKVIETIKLSCGDKSKRLEINLVQGINIVRREDRTIMSMSDKDFSIKSEINEKFGSSTLEKQLTLK